MSDPWKRRVEIGDAVLYLGDCLEILPTLPKVDAVITDPPYGLGFPYLSYDDTPENLATLIPGMVEKCKRMARVVGISCGIINLQRYPVADWAMALCWNTTGNHGMFGFNQWMAILLYGKDSPLFDRGEGVIKSDVIFENGGGSVGFQRWDEEKSSHPCPKPEGLVRKLVRRLSTGAVCDPFMGSGTTGIACAQLGRKFIGIEIEPKYFDIACRRIDDAYRQGKLFEEPKPKPVQDALI